MEYKNYKIADFLKVLSSNSSMPGGGTASSLLSANAVSLALKVINLTIGKEKYKDNESFVIEQKEKLLSLKEDFLTLMDEDAKEFKVMEDVFKMPKNSDEEKEKRKQALIKASKICCKIPKIVMEKSIETLSIINSLYDKTTIMASSDLTTSDIFINAAINGAWQNILINLKYIDDMKFKEEYENFGKSVFKKIK